MHFCQILKIVCHIFDFTSNSFKQGQIAQIKEKMLIFDQFDFSKYQQETKIGLRENLGKGLKKPFQVGYVQLKACFELHRT